MSQRPPSLRAAGVPARECAAPQVRAPWLSGCPEHACRRNCEDTAGALTVGPCQHHCEMTRCLTRCASLNLRRAVISRAIYAAHLEVGPQLLILRQQNVRKVRANHCALAVEHWPRRPRLPRRQNPGCCPAECNQLEALRLARDHNANQRQHPAVHMARSHPRSRSPI